MTRRLLGEPARGASTSATPPRRTGAKVAIFDRDVLGSNDDLRLESYACAAMLDGEVETSFPPYERRSWILRDLAHRHGRVALFVGATPLRCILKLETCRVMSRGVVRVRLRGRSPLEAARALGILDRPLSAVSGSSPTPNTAGTSHTHQSPLRF